MAIFVRTGLNEELTNDLAANGESIFNPREWLI